VAAVGNVTLGQAIASGSTRWQSVVASPMLIAAILGLVAAVLHIALPLWLNNTLELISSLAIPLMLLMLGTSLATIQVAAMRRAVGLSVLRVAWESPSASPAGLGLVSPVSQGPCWSCSVRCRSP
jgi:predicted permease